MLLESGGVRSVGELARFHAGQLYGKLRCHRIVDEIGVLVESLPSRFQAAQHR